MAGSIYVHGSIFVQIYYCSLAEISHFGFVMLIIMLDESISLSANSHTLYIAFIAKSQLPTKCICLVCDGEAKDDQEVCGS